MSRVGILVCAETEWGANEYVGQLNVASTEEDSNNNRSTVRQMQLALLFPLLILQQLQNKRTDWVPTRQHKPPRTLWRLVMAERSHSSACGVCVTWCVPTIEGISPTGHDRPTVCPMVLSCENTTNDKFWTTLSVKGWIVFNKAFSPNNGMSVQTVGRRNETVFVLVLPEYSLCRVKRSSCGLSHSFQLNQSFLL